MKEVIEEGCHEVIALLHDYEAVSNQLGEPMDPDAMEKLLEKQSMLQEKIEAADERIESRKKEI